MRAQSAWQGYAWLAISEALEALLHITLGRLLRAMAFGAAPRPEMSKPELQMHFRTTN